MRVTHDAALTQIEISRALEKLGLVVGENKGRVFGRSPDAVRRLAQEMTRPYAKSDLVGPDAPRVTRDEAVEHVIHHLVLAAMFFEATPDDRGGQVDEELLRLRERVPEHVRNAASAFVQTLDAYYESLKGSEE